MKKLTLYYLLLFIICISCKQTDIKPVLTQAENLMETKPDSSLLLLESIEHPEKMSKLDYATWCLLVTQARDKNYVEHTSDSVINIATKYYKKEKNKKRLSQSYYCSGRVKQDLKQDDNALKDYLIALTNGEHTEEYKLCGFISNRIGQIYRQQFSEEMALPYYTRSYTYFIQAKDTASCSFALRDIGRIYGEIEPKQSDSALHYYRQAYELAKKINHQALQSSILNDMGREYEQIKEYPSAYTCIIQSIELSSGKESLLLPKYLNLGELYLKMEKPDSARYYLQKSMKSSNLNTKSGGFWYLSELEASIGNYKEACAYKDSFQVYSDSIQTLTYSDQIIKIEKQYQAEKSIIQIQTKELNKRIIWITLSGSLILLLVVVIFFNQQRQHKRMQLLRQKEQDISRLKVLLHNTSIQKNKSLAQIEQLETENRDLQLKNQNLSINSEEFTENSKKLKKGENKIAELTKQLKLAEQAVNEQTPLQDQIKQLQMIILNQSYVYTKIAPYIQKSRKDKQDENMIFDTEQWEELITAVDNAYSNFLTRLKEQFKLDSDHLITASLIKLEINPTHMQIVLNINTPSLITRRKKKLAEKLQIEPSTLDDFLSIF